MSIRVFEFDREGNIITYNDRNLVERIETKKEPTGEDDYWMTHDFEYDFW